MPPIGCRSRNSDGKIISERTGDMDLAVLKNTPVRKISEVFNVQFRAELFNLANHPNWGQPGNSIFLNGANGGTLNPAAGRITSIIGNTRQIQLGIRIGF